MAVGKTNQQQPMVKHYWPQYKRTALTLTVLMQLVLTLFIGVALVIGGFEVTSFKFWLVMIAASTASLGLNIILINLLLIPLKDITSALTHVSGELTDVIPPNPNAKHFERDGFKPLLQLIYKSAANDQQPDADTDEATSLLPQLRQALEQTSAGIVIMNTDGVVKYANKKAPVSRGTDEVPHLELIFEQEGEFAEWLKDCRDRAVHSEKSWLRVANKIVGEENRRIFDMTATYEKGSAAEVVVVLFDRSNTYQPEDDDLDFIAFAAHELRGPITIIRGYLDVLEVEIGAVLQPDQKELMKRLVVSANRLSGYINNILNASRFDRRHLKIHLSEESLASIYDTINDDMQMRAQVQTRLLSVNIPTDLPTVAVDRSSISEVIANLIDNALKYSNEGGAVNVGAIIDGSFLKVYIEDHGIGIPASVIGNLFHKFYRSHRSRETVAGTGIGLYICKAIVESHGGTIGVKSVEGQGSMFTFTIPIYATVADKLLANNSTNEGFINSGSGWIKNHSMYKG